MYVKKLKRRNLKMVDQNAVIYIHLEDGLHTYGFVLEIPQKFSREKRYQQMADDFISSMRSEEFKDVFGLFWQTGSNDKYGGYNYFEIWSKLTSWKQDVMLSFIQLFAKEWNILCDIDRPKDFPI